VYIYKAIFCSSLGVDNCTGPEEQPANPPEDSDNNPQATWGRKRKEPMQDVSGDPQGPSQLKEELMQLRKRVHRVEDDVAVHKEYCTGVFEALFSSMKDKDLERCLTCTLRSFRALLPLNHCYICMCVRWGGGRGERAGVHVYAFSGECPCTCTHTFVCWGLFWKNLQVGQGEVPRGFGSCSVKPAKM
jgi:hypothetical protein